MVILRIFTEEQSNKFRKIEKVQTNLNNNKYHLDFNIKSFITMKAFEILFIKVNPVLNQIQDNYVYGNGKHVIIVIKP